MSGHTDAWQELNEAQQQYQDAVEQQQRVQERYLPPGDRRAPHSPVQLPDPLPLKVIEALSAVDRHVQETRQRYARAINSVHAEV